MGQSERLIEFIENINISRAEFERRSGLANGYVKKLKGNLGENKLNDILRAFPNLNRVWLLTGEGEMLNSNKQDFTRQNATNEAGKNDFSDYETWLLPQTAHGGSLTNIPADATLLQNCEKIISPIKGVDFAISVYGDSMAPEYPSGSRVLIKKINPEVFIDWGRVYVLDTSNGVIIKKVIKSNTKGYVTCRSVNPDPIYSDFDVPLKEIYGMYRVLMCLSAK